MTMRSMTLDEVKRAVNGHRITAEDTRSSEEIRVSKVSRDSREIPGDCLFFALVGENRDGHDYIKDAVDRGCEAVVAERTVSFSGSEDVEYILVDDTTKALQDLARYYLKTIGPKTVGITGSTGKTTTKEMTYRVLSEKYITGCNFLNYNNHIGLPLTVLDFSEDTEAAVLEMGMDRPGEIDFLAELVRPDIGVITNIGLSHIEHLKTRENIFKAKMEIKNYFKEDDLLLVCQGEDFLRKGNIEGKYRSAVAGTGSDCDLLICDIEDRGEGGSTFTLEAGEAIDDWEGVRKGGARGRFRLALPGEHNVMDAALAAAAGLYMGVTMEEAARALRDMNPAEKRGAVIDAGGIKVINDAYNASPDSVRAALKVLAGTKGSRRVAVLGDMFELGEKAPEYHREMGEFAKDIGIDRVICVGELSRNTALGAGKKASHFPDKETLYESITDCIRPGDVVLIKGSRGMAMEDIIDVIKEKCGVI